MQIDNPKRLESEKLYEYDRHASAIQDNCVSNSSPDDNCASYSSPGVVLERVYYIF